MTLTTAKKERLKKNTNIVVLSNGIKNLRLKKVFPFNLIIIILVFTSVNTYAFINRPNSTEYPLGSKENPIRVGVTEGKPFSHIDGKHIVGLAPLIWQKIASERNWSYTYINFGENVEAGIKSIVNKKINVLIGPISVNYDRLKRVNYTRPYYINKMGIALHDKGINFAKILKGFESKFSKEFIIFCSTVFLFAVHLCWFIEKKSGNISRSYFKGIIMSALVLLNYLFHRKYSIQPLSVMGKIFSTCWFFIVAIFLIFISSFIGYFIVYKIVHYNYDIKSEKELHYHKLAYVKGQQNVKIIKNMLGVPKEFPSLSGALYALNNNKNGIKGVVGNYIILKDKIKELDLKNIKMSAFNFAHDEIAFAVQYDSPLLKGINQTLVKLQDQGIIARICRSIFYQDDGGYCNL